MLFHLALAGSSTSFHHDHSFPLQDESPVFIALTEKDTFNFSLILRNTGFRGNKAIWYSKSLLSSFCCILKCFCYVAFLKVNYGRLIHS